MLFHQRVARTKEGVSSQYKKRTNEHCTDERNSYMFRIQSFIRSRVRIGDSMMTIRPRIRKASGVTWYTRKKRERETTRYRTLASLLAPRKSDHAFTVQSSLEIGWHSSESHSARASPRRGGNSSVSRLSGTATAESMLSK